MRLIHTSDWHLGRIFHGIHLTDDQAYILDQFVDLIKDIKPDGILVAGDIFDRSVPPTEAVNLLDEVVSRILMDYQIPIIMIAGNHDSPDRLGFGSRVMKEKGLHIIGRFDMEMEAMVLYDQHGAVSFHAVPYVEPAIVRDKFEDDSVHGHDASMFKLIHHVKTKMNPNHRNILITHAFAAGGEESESERPLSVGGSGAVNASYFHDFDYVALGHLHRPQKVGKEWIRYSGSLMKYSFSEANHRKHVLFVEIQKKGKISIEEVALKPRRDIRCLEGYLQDILKGSRDEENKEDYIMVTLKDEGAILDAMGKLRKVYPNVLHIERTQLLTGNRLVGADKNFKKINEVDLFASFIHQVTEREMTEQQRHVFIELLDRYNQDLREGILHEAP